VNNRLITTLPVCLCVCLGCVFLCSSLWRIDLRTNQPIDLLLLPLLVA
jgi:hypothetical protein